MTTHTDQANRVQSAVDSMVERLADLEPAKIVALQEACEPLTFDELVVMRDAVALAQANDRLTLEEALTAQAILGHGPALTPLEFADATRSTFGLAEYMVICQLVVELGR